MEISIIEKLLENVPGVTTNGDCRDKTEILVLISGSNSWNKKKNNNEQKNLLSERFFSAQKEHKIMTNSYPLSVYGTIFTLSEETFRTKEFESRLFL